MFNFTKEKWSSVNGIQDVKNTPFFKANMKCSAGEELQNLAESFGIKEEFGCLTASEVTRLQSPLTSKKDKGAVQQQEDQQSSCHRQNHAHSQRKESSFTPTSESRSVSSARRESGSELTQRSPYNAQDMRSIMSEPYTYFYSGTPTMVPPYMQYKEEYDRIIERTLSSGIFSQSHSTVNKEPFSNGSTVTDKVTPPKLSSDTRALASKRIHPCNVCGKSFTKVYSLTTHQRIHTGERPYSCPECGKAFTEGSKLTKHRRIHSGDWPYTCPQCGKGFSDSYNLARHHRSHTGERPYRCDECGKAFSRTSQLTEHRRIHTGERPYQCQQCGKCFSQSGKLTKHKRAHNGGGGSSDRPSSADSCEPVNELSKHKLNSSHQHPIPPITGERPFPCHQCGLTFARPDFLRHVTSYHLGLQQT